MPALQSRTDLLLELADDELVLGWRNSEWTGIAPALEEDVAFSSIAQNEIGHARALYALAAGELGTTADELAFDRDPDERRCAPLCELRLVPDWGRTIARHVLYELADEIRIAALKESPDAPGGRARRQDRPRGDVPPAARADVGRALAGVGRGPREARGRRAGAVALRARRARAGRAAGAGHARRGATSVGLPADTDPVERGEHLDALREVWEQMTRVRRTAPGAAW